MLMTFIVAWTFIFILFHVLPLRRSTKNLWPYSYDNGKRLQEERIELQKELRNIYGLALDRYKL
jgi:hypothetical protein